jgi:hypothetical protein
MSGTTGARVGASNIQWLPVAKLIPYARNARTHTDAQVAQIAASIREFGFNNPVLVDADGGIIAGHGRVMAARKLAMADVPTITLPHLTDTQKRAFILADNRIALNAGWDDDLLAIELTELNIDGFALDILGFTQEEIDALLSPEVTIGDGDPDDAPLLPDAATTRAGDVWICGDHRLMCGDALDTHAVVTVLSCNPSACVTILDPPYEMAPVVWRRFMTDPCIFFGPGKALSIIPPELYRFERVIAKAYRHRSATVQIDHRHAFIVQVGSVKTLPANTMTFPSIVEQERGTDTEHQHQKPATLIAEHLQHWTPTGLHVFDPFCGSGSSLVASEIAGRRCYAVELDPRFCDVAVTRWQTFTGKVATRESDGQPFTPSQASNDPDQ